MSDAPVTAEELAEAARIKRMGEILPASRAVDLMHRLAHALTTERAASARLAAELADLKSDDTLRDLAAARESTHRIADRCLDLGRENEALRAVADAARALLVAGPASAEAFDALRAALVVVTP